MIFLPDTNTVILLEPYCCTMTEPGLPVLELVFSANGKLNSKELVMKIELAEIFP